MATLRTAGGPPGAARTALPLLPALLAVPGMDQQWEPFACMGIGIIFYALIIILWIWSSIWVYRDAKSRNLEMPVLWLLIALLVWPIGIIIYLALRSSLKQAYPPPGYYPPPYPYQQYQQPYQQPYGQQQHQQQPYSPYDRVVTEEVHEYEVAEDTYEKRW